ncbi:MAG: hypothetical protein ABR913_07655 [Sedimentisphaerales bacterium]|jgi:hypothetical protein
MSEPDKTGNPLDTSTNLKRLAKTVKSVGESFLFVGATSYVTGVMVVSLYLGIFNAPAMSLLKINYVLTGMLAIIPLLFWVILICPAMVLFKSVKSFVGQINLIFWAWFVFLFSLMMFVYGFVFWRLGTYLFIDMGFEWEVYVITLGTGLLVFIILLSQWAEKLGMKVGRLVFVASFSLFVVVSLYIGHFSLLVTGVIIFIGFFVILLSLCRGAEKLGTKYCALLCVAAIPLYIYHFSFDVYPKISFQFGGAKYVNVQIFIDPNSEIKDSFERCKLTKDEEKQGVWEGYLAFSTDTEYLFCGKSTDANEVVCIKKEDVKAIKSQIRPPGKKPNGR